MIKCGFNKESLIPFRLHRDIRTLIYLANYDIKSRQFEGIKHNALEDCKNQINIIVDCLKMIK